MYRVTIQKIEKETIQGREWKPTGKKKTSDHGKEEEEYAWVYFDELKEIERTILTQTVDELNLIKVVKAINNLE